VSVTDPTDRTVSDSERDRKHSLPYTPTSGPLRSVRPTGTSRRGSRCNRDSRPYTVATGDRASDGSDGPGSTTPRAWIVHGRDGHCVTVELYGQIGSVCVTVRTERHSLPYTLTSHGGTLRPDRASGPLDPVVGTATVDVQSVTAHGYLIRYIDTLSRCSLQCMYRRECHSAPHIVSRPLHTDTSRGSLYGTDAFPTECLFSPQKASLQDLHREILPPQKQYALSRVG
jgi:hypothetical protein